MQILPTAICVKSASALVGNRDVGDILPGCIGHLYDGQVKAVHCLLKIIFTCSLAHGSLLSCVLEVLLLLSNISCHECTQSKGNRSELHHP